MQTTARDIPLLSDSDKERFLSKVNKTEDSCWMWGGSHFRSGYGCFSIKSKSFTAHRISFAIFNGEIPKTEAYHGMMVCHKCDVRGCVNPSHLFLGTAKDNAVDKVNKGRANFCCGENHYSKIRPEVMQRGDMHWSRREPSLTLKGEKHGMAKINASIVIQIREMAASGMHPRDIAKIVGISRPQTYGIISRKYWKHIQ